MIDKKNGSGIEIVIHSLLSDEAYTEYIAKKGNALYTGSRNECFIEGRPGDKYAIQVFIPETAHFGTSNCFWVQWSVDNGAITGAEAVHKQYEEEVKQPDGRLMEQISQFLRETGDGEWEDCNLTFNEVEVGKSCARYRASKARAKRTQLTIRPHSLARRCRTTCCGAARLRSPCSLVQPTALPLRRLCRNFAARGFVFPTRPRRRLQ
jgi:hypothetical protein